MKFSPRNTLPGTFIFFMVTAKLLGHQKRVHDDDREVSV